MMLPTLITTSLLLAASVSAQFTGDIPSNIADDIAERSRNENVEDILREYIETLSDDDTNLLFRRQAAPSPTDSNPTIVPSNITPDVADRSRNENVEDILREYIAALPDDGTNILSRRQSAQAPTGANSPDSKSSLWGTATLSACTTALNMLRGLASSPSGMAFCYNLPFLDNSTGVFQADLRLFTINAPTGAFANVAAKDVAVGVQYVGATVQAIPTTELTPRDLEARRYPLFGWPPARRSERAQIAKRQSQGPVLAQSYAFVGQINKNLLTANLNSSALQAILIPAVTLSAINNAAANTTLSPLEATFVNGLFSDQPKTMATISVAGVIANVAFVLPGTKIMVFPIGAIITGAWAFAFIGVVGWGTVGRMGFRENYRRRLARAEKAGFRTI